jgi:uncharacterized protein with NRDE domain
MQVLHYFSNRDGHSLPVSPGVHGLSNHLLDAPWPKVRRGRQQLAALLEAPVSALTDAMFGFLSDRSQAQDHELPDTGVGLEWERALSAPFIVYSGYGTRASTVLLVDRDGHATFEERSYADAGRETGRRRFSLRFGNASGQAPHEGNPALFR